MSHLDEGRLTALLDNELTAAERDRAGAHLKECADCRRLLEEIQAFATEADGLVASVELPARGSARATSPPVVTRRPWWVTGRWRTLAWAASVVMAVSLGWYASDLRIHSGPASPAGRGPAAPAEDAAPSEPAPKLSAAPPAAKAAALGESKPARRDAESSPQRAADPAPGAPATLQLAETADNRGAFGRANSSAEGGAREMDRAAPAVTPPTTAPAKERAAREGRAEAADQVAQGSFRARGEPAGFRPASMEEAVRILGGSIRLLDGLAPRGLLVGPSGPGPDSGIAQVRVVYEDPPGRELWLDQQRPEPGEPGDRARPLLRLLPGDTVVTRGTAGTRSVHWMDQSGFRLVLTGFLEVDSLAALTSRVH